MLLEAQRHGDLDDQAERGLAAILALVGVRLRDLGRAVRGNLAPGVLLAQHNAALDGVRPGEDQDMVLLVRPDCWSPRARQK